MFCAKQHKENVFEIKKIENQAIIKMVQWSNFYLQKIKPYNKFQIS